MMITGLIFGLCFGVGAFISDRIFNSQFAFNEDELSEEDENWAIQDGNRTNILILGVDARPGEKQARSDTMMLASIDPKLNKVAIISIPRDTRVSLKGSNDDKICTANYIGGPKYATQVVEKLLGVKIDHYIQVDFNGFEGVIDTLGGVNIDVERRMYKPSEGINLHAGQQTLKGKDALAYVRFRDYTNGDIQRVEQQQKFIKALAEETLKPKTIVKLPSLIKQIGDYVNTDIRLSDALKMVSWAPGFSKDSIISQTLPGYFYDVRDQNGRLWNSFWIVDKKSLPRLLDNLFAGKAVAVMADSPAQQIVPQQTANLHEKDRKKIDSDKERAKLPSPGHGTEKPIIRDTQEIVTNAGPEGFI